MNTKTTKNLAARILNVLPRSPAAPISLAKICAALGLAIDGSKRFHVEYCAVSAELQRLKDVSLAEYIRGKGSGWRRAARGGAS